MPYFITDNAEGCSGWATIKEDDEVLGCHQSKQEAIDQMIALSIAEDIEPGGERKIHYKKKKMKRDLPDNYRPALAEDVPEGRACGNCFFYNEEIVNDDRTMAYCEKWKEFVDGGFYCNAWQEDEEDRVLPDAVDVGDFVSWNSSGGRARGQIKRIERDGAIDVPNTSFTITGTPDDPAALIAIYERFSGGWRETDTLVGHKFSTLTKIDDLPEPEEEDRQINLSPPAYMRAAARRGLELNRQGRGGDGLTDKTKQEAREMAAGRVSEDKWVRTAAWIARHLVDLDAPQNSDPQDAGYPGAGLVAHLLWGSGPSKRAAMRTMAYAEGVVERIRAEEDRSRWASVDIHLRENKGEKVSKVERRVKNDIDFEIRVDEAQSDGMRFSGYAAVFNSNSEPLPFTERILPGAFMRSLKSRNEVKLFKNHNMDDVLASTRSKTLTLTEDSKGLLAEAVLPNTTAGRDLAELMKRGDVHSMSFGFSVPPKGDNWSDDGAVRELKEIRLHEVSIVTGFPAYSATTATIRSLDFLASRTAVDADQLADVMLKLEAGETLPEQEADLLVEVVQKLRENKEPSHDMSNLELLKKKIDILYKAV
jgi:HK97 family phage prohead protease